MLVFDKSGSMMVVDRKDVVAFGTDILNQLDIVPTHSKAGVVTFSTRGSLDQALTGDRDEANRAINNFPAPRGGTNIGQGLELAKQQLVGVEPGVKRVIILLSDGEQSPWVGGTPAAIQTATEVKTHNISIFAVGFGAVSKTTLESIASTPASRFALFSRNGLPGIISHFASNLCGLVGSSVKGEESSPSLQSSQSVAEASATTKHAWPFERLAMHKAARRAARRRQGDDPSAALMMHNGPLPWATTVD